MAEADPISSELQVFDVHRTRSRLLDAFARIENQIGRLSEEAGVEHNYKYLLGNRVESLRKAIAASGHNKGLEEKLKETAELVILRGNIVHAEVSELQEAEGGAKHFVFSNPPFQRHKATVVSAEDLTKYRKRAFEIANELKASSVSTNS